MITRQELLTKVLDTFGFEIRTYNINPQQIVNFVQDQIMEYCKPNCIHCYDKGYSTEFYGLSSSSDFEGERGFETKKRIHILYCVCERGQDLKKTIEKNYDAK